MYWRVNAEATVFAGGGRALLMQVAHPGVGAGVEQHSSYASDPWGRFFRTVDIMMKLSFGSPEVSCRQARVLAKMHSRVVGTDEHGSTYSASDPRLQIWVWATLVDSALLVYNLVDRPLLPDELERYYAESKLMAYGCGVPLGLLPDRWADFQAYVADTVANDLCVGASARKVACATMVPPLPGPLKQLAAIPHQVVTRGLLPPPLREQYGFEWSAGDERQLRLWLALARAGSLATPRILRQLGARYAVGSHRSIRVPWLQRRGAEITAVAAGGIRRKSEPYPGSTPNPVAGELPSQARRPLTSTARTASSFRLTSRSTVRSPASALRSRRRAVRRAPRGR